MVKLGVTKGPKLVTIVVSRRKYAFILRFTVLAVGVVTGACFLHAVGREVELFSALGISRALEIAAECVSDALVE